MMERKQQRHWAHLHSYKRSKRGELVRDLWMAHSIAIEIRDNGLGVMNSMFLIGRMVLLSDAAWERFIMRLHYYAVPGWAVAILWEVRRTTK